MIETTRETMKVKRNMKKETNDNRRKHLNHQHYFEETPIEGIDMEYMRTRNRDPRVIKRFKCRCGKEIITFNKNYHKDCTRLLQLWFQEGCPKKFNIAKQKMFF